MIVRLSSLSNVAMLVTVLTSLSRSYPDDTFVLVSLKWLEPLLHGLPNVRYHEASAEVEHGSGLIRLAREIAAYGPSAVFDLQDDRRTRPVRWLLRWRRIPVYTIDHGSKERRKLMRQGFERSTPLRTERARYCDTFAAGGLQPTGEVPLMAVDAEAQGKVLEFFGEKKGRWIGIAPFAKYQSNILPYKTMKEVIAHYAREDGTRVFLFGAGHVETEMLRQWASLWPGVESVTDRLPLSGEMELMRMLDGMLCMDSANQHLAALVGCPVVSIWCGTHPYMGFAAWKMTDKQVLSLPITCRPCSINGTDRCKYRNFACKAFAAEQIVKRFDSMLNSETTKQMTK